MIELRQTLRLSQQLVMTPQLQMAIKLLQLSRFEMETLVQQELVENPLLEETPTEQAAPADGEAQIPASQSRAETTGPVTGDERAVGEVDWDRYLDQHADMARVPGGVRRDTDDRPSFEAGLTRREDLVDHLLDQVRLSRDFNDRDKRVAAYIVGNLADDGYFREPTLTVVAQHLHEQCPGVTVDDCWRVMRKVQRLDPVGVAARDLAECLLIQAEQQGELTADVERIIRFHIPNLEKKNYRAIARDLGIDLKLVLELAQLIREDFHPRPGAEHNTAQPIYVTPDVFVHKDGDEYFVVSNDHGLPRLRISSYYRKAVKEHGGARAYIHDKMRSAQWLIRSIHQRQRTILRVTESIVRFQREFLDDGIDFLRPLILRDVAEDIGMHESTVSRVTTHKYVSCPQGLFELKFFFNSGISRRWGSPLASESVKSRIRQLVASENPRLPHSDQALVSMLKAEDIEIARRTVAKYRDMLGILPSSRRRQP